MNTFTLKLEQSWEQVKEMLKENDYELTEEDLQYEPGEEKELLERLAKKMNRSTEEVKMLVESISANDGKAS
ncbi:MAG TPA: hypothetical protein VFV68_08980 [Agriterribacter sp.]|nr:hypothetical protein [Agriterribacter sp.]